jgi:hypothetical protein
MDRREFLQTATLLGVTTAVEASSPASSQQYNAAQFTQIDARRKISSAEFGSVSKMLDNVAPLSLHATSSTDIIPDILQPIDVGALELLRPYTLAPLQHSPMEVEYLANTLDDHIANCLSLREKAQQLEVLAAAQRLEVLLEGKTIEFMTRLADLNKLNDGKIVGSMFQPKLEQNSISSSGGDPYYAERRSIEDIHITARRAALDARLVLMQRAGSGNHNVERFEFIKAAFQREFIEAYRRAKAVEAGIKAVYGIDNKPLPEVSDVGYLSKLALWSKDVFYELERRVMNTTFTTFAVALRKGTDASSLLGLMSDAEFNTGRAAGVFKFQIDASYFEASTAKLHRPRLRGLEAYIWADPRPLDYMRIKVELPDQTVKIGSNIVWAARGRSVFLPLSTYPQGPEFQFQTRREVHNANPIGEWEIQIDKRTLTDRETAKDDVLRNIFLVMRIASEIT